VNKEAYLNQLEKYLKRLPREEFEQAMDYFREHFEDAGEAHEAAVIEELGSPREAAAELLGNLLAKQTEQKGKQNQIFQGKSIKLTVLALLAAPIGIPLFAAGILTLLSGILAGICVLAGAACAVAGGVLIGGKLLIRGILAAPYSISGFLFITGSGILLFGLAILVGVGLWKLSRLMERGLMALVKKILRKGKA
jgi:uncharacterized membrane protein